MSAECPQAKYHGDPFRYCSCGWMEEGAPERRTDHGVVFGWGPMHEKRTRVTLMPNPYGPTTPKKLDVGVDYPEAGIVRFQHMGPNARCHGVQVDVHFDGDSVRILAWTDPNGDRDADLIVELGEDAMSVERMRPAAVLPPDSTPVDFGQQMPGSSNAMPEERRKEYEQRISNARPPGIRKHAR